MQIHPIGTKRILEIVFAAEIYTKPNEIHPQSETLLESASLRKTAMQKSEWSPIISG